MKAEPRMTNDVRAFMTELSSRPEVLGVAVFGSHARGDARPDADVDVFALVGEGVWRDVEHRDGRTYELLFASEREAREFYAQNPDDCVSTWGEAHILCDKEGRMEALRAYAAHLADAGRKKAGRGDVRHRKYEAEDKLRAARHLAVSDYPTAYMALHDLAARLIETHYAKEGSWLPPPKQRLTSLRRAWPELAGLFDEFYSQTSWEGKVAALEKIMGAVFGE
jgi:hypothetical protein